jgi:hypothetical protein
MKGLPVEYHYEFYTTRFGDPFYGCQTSNPLATISKGDYLDWRGFRDFPLEVASKSRLRVESVEHILWEIENDHIGHKIMYVIEVVKDSV